MICSFFGHRDVELTEELIERTKAEINKAVKDGCRIFYFGGYGDFDDLCYKIVTDIKNEKPDLDIKRVFCVSKEKELRKLPRGVKREDYEEMIYPNLSFDYWYTSIYYRNCAMIDDSEKVIFYVEQRENSGAYKAYQYATKKKKNIINLF